MMRLMTILCAMLMSASALRAQTNDRQISAKDVVITHTGDNVTVVFTLEAGKKATKATNNLVITPVLENAGNEQQLPAIVIRGKRSKVIDLRHELMGGTRPEEQIIAPGTSIGYTATVPFQEWMVGGTLGLNGVSVGCCSQTRTDLGLVADNILRGEPTIDMRFVEVPIIVPKGLSVTGMDCVMFGLSDFIVSACFFMKYKEIDLNDLGAVLRPGVWLSRGQLADLFGVYYGTITANIKAIIRSGVVWPSFEGTLVQVGKTVLPERYDMEMVIALAFRLHSPAAERIRKYVMQRVAAGIGRPAPQIFFSCGVGVVVN